MWVSSLDFISSPLCDTRGLNGTDLLPTLLSMSLSCPWPVTSQPVPPSATLLHPATVTTKTSSKNIYEFVCQLHELNPLLHPLGAREGEAKGSKSSQAHLEQWGPARAAWLEHSMQSWWGLCQLKAQLKTGTGIQGGLSNDCAVWKSCVSQELWIFLVTYWSQCLSSPN